MVPAGPLLKLSKVWLTDSPLLSVLRGVDFQQAHSWLASGCHRNVDQLGLITSCWCRLAPTCWRATKLQKKKESQLKRLPLLELEVSCFYGWGHTHSVQVSYTVNASTEKWRFKVRALNSTIALKVSHKQLGGIWGLNQCDSFLWADMAEPHDCQKCCLSFSSLEEHQQHLQEFHPKDFHKCTICNKAFTSSALLDKHKATHAGSKPFSCELCNKSYQVGVSSGLSCGFQGGPVPCFYTWKHVLASESQWSVWQFMRWLFDFRNLL